MIDDRRTRHTKERIRQAMLACLETTSLDKVTVKQICDAADINRSTFYSHYSNPTILYKQMEQNMTDSMNRYFLSLKNKSVSYTEFLHHFLECCYENGELFLALYRTDSASLRKAFLNLIVSYDFLTDTVPDSDKTYIFDYYISGVFCVIARWLHEDRTKSIDDMTRMLYRLTYKPAQSKKS